MSCGRREGVEKKRREKKKEHGARTRAQHALMARPGDKMTMIIGVFVTEPRCTRVNALLERKKHRCNICRPKRLGRLFSFFATTYSMRVMEDKFLYEDVRKGKHGINI